MSSSADKLWDLDESYNEKRKEIAGFRLDLMKNIKGDAMYELIETYTYYGKDSDNNHVWLSDEESGYGETYYNDDEAVIGHSYLCFLVRGGAWWDDIKSGIFSSHGTWGRVGGTTSFRPTLIIE